MGRKHNLHDRMDKTFTAIEKLWGKTGMNISWTMELGDEFQGLRVKASRQMD